MTNHPGPHPAVAPDTDAAPWDAILSDGPLPPEGDPTTAAAGAVGLGGLAANGRRPQGGVPPSALVGVLLAAGGVGALVGATLCPWRVRMRRGPGASARPLAVRHGTAVAVRGQGSGGAADLPVRGHIHPGGRTPGEVAPREAEHLVVARGKAR